MSCGDEVEGPDCIEDVHIFEVEMPVSNTPDDRRCECGAVTWSEMDIRLLETMWKLTV